MRRSKALFAGKIAIPKRLLILVVGPVYRDIELKVVDEVSVLYTRLLFGGRQPLCGTGVTSTIEVTLKPRLCNARIAESLPMPGPLTFTRTSFMPCDIATRPAS